MKQKILVTGVGAIIGYGVLRSLAQFKSDLELYSCDIYSDAVGQVWSDYFTVSPYVSDPQYLEWVLNLVKKHKIDLIIPAIEQDLFFFNENRKVLEEKKINVVLNDPHLIDLAKDKWISHQKFSQFDEQLAIPTLMSSDFIKLRNNLGLPFIIKPRQGYASKGIIIIHNETQFSEVKNLMKTIYIAQKIVGTNEQEFTSSVFGDGKGGFFSSISFRRKLAADGSTAKAWVYQSAELEALLDRFCKYFKPRGPTNIQLRKDEDQWKILEVNPRLSSSTSLRTKFGHNEAKMCVDFFLNGKIIKPAEIKEGFALRYIEDYVLYDCKQF